jgi:hypothetical protein
METQKPYCRYSREEDLPIGNYTYHLQINSTKVSIIPKLALNLFYWLFPSDTPKKIAGRKEKLRRSKSLENDEILMSATPLPIRCPHP